MLSAVSGSPTSASAAVGGADGRSADAGQRDPCPGHRPAGGLHRHRDADGGEVADPALQLEVAARPGALRRRDDRLHRDLVRLQHVLERAGDEVRDRDGPPAAVAPAPPPSRRAPAPPRPSRPAGSAWQSEPTSVPRLRTMRVGDQRRGRGHGRLGALAAGPSAPGRRGGTARRCGACRPGPRGGSRGRATLLMSTISSGEAKRSFISGTRLWPPASTFASSPPSRSRLIASPSERGAS